MQLWNVFCDLDNTDKVLLLSDGERMCLKHSMFVNSSIFLALCSPSPRRPETKPPFSSVSFQVAARFASFMDSHRVT